MQADAPNRTRTASLAALVSLSVSLAASSALAQAPLRPGPVASVGTPQSGSIASRGVELPLSGPGFHWVTNRGNPNARYGTPTLVGALERAAAAVLRDHPGSDLAIHDVSLPGGGRLRGHGSHTSGRDVDVAYYARDAAGAAVNPTTSVWFDARGRRGALALDVTRTWALLAELLGDPTITVQYIFVYPPLRAMLLAHARTHAAPALAAAAARVMRTPHGRNMDPHADHFHVRILCPPQDARCRG